ncbi:hypothetical protein EDD86DRAFT_199654 [Gorgonomyces haynaldii]|nr:hypothetical protein EDD86DRAFT_199654 [Gorgonomyces haynaldii]
MFKRSNLSTGLMVVTKPPEHNIMLSSVDLDIDRLLDYFDPLDAERIKLELEQGAKEIKFKTKKASEFIANIDRSQNLYIWRFRDITIVEQLKQFLTDPLIPSLSCILSLSRFGLITHMASGDSFLGSSRQDLENAPIMQFIPNPDLPLVCSRMMDVFHTGRAKFTTRWQLVPKLEDKVSSPPPSPRLQIEPLPPFVDDIVLEPHESTQRRQSFHETYKRPRGLTFATSSSKPPLEDPRYWVHVTVDAFLVNESLICYLETKDTQQALRHLHPEIYWTHGKITTPLQNLLNAYSFVEHGVGRIVQTSSTVLRSQVITIKQMVLTQINYVEGFVGYIYQTVVVKRTHQAQEAVVLARNSIIRQLDDTFKILYQFFLGKRVRTIKS